MSKVTKLHLGQLKKILTTLGQDKAHRGAQAKIYYKYVDLLKQFLRIGAKHDIDGDGKLWCKKEEWVAWLSPQISDDDGNAIGYTHCSKGKTTTTALEMTALIQQGKEYICHRLYNQLHIKMEKRKEGKNVAYFRSLLPGEKPTPPSPDSVYILKTIFRKKGKEVEGKGEEKIYVLGVNEACGYLLAALPSKFDTEDAKIEEWQRVIGVLEIQNLVKFDKGSYSFNAQGW